MLLPMNWEVPQNVTKHDSSFMNYNCSILSGSNESVYLFNILTEFIKHIRAELYYYFDKDEDDILIPPSMDLIFAKHGTETAIVNTKNTL